MCQAFGREKEDGAKRRPKAIKKTEKTDLRRKSVSSHCKIKTFTRVLSAATSVGGESTGASYTHEISDVEADDDGALTISPRSSSGKGGISNRLLVLSLFVK